MDFLEWYNLLSTITFVVTPSRPSSLNENETTSDNDGSKSDQEKESETIDTNVKNEERNEQTTSEIVSPSSSDQSVVEKNLGSETKATSELDQKKALQTEEITESNKEKSVEESLQDSSDANTRSETSGQTQEVLTSLSSDNLSVENSSSSSHSDSALLLSSRDLSNETDGTVETPPSGFDRFTWGDDLSDIVKEYIREAWDLFELDEFFDNLVKVRGFSVIDRAALEPRDDIKPDIATITDKQSVQWYFYSILQKFFGRKLKKSKGERFQKASDEQRDFLLNYEEKAETTEKPGKQQVYDIDDDWESLFGSRPRSRNSLDAQSTSSRSSRRHRSRSSPLEHTKRVGHRKTLDALFAAEDV